MSYALTSCDKPLSVDSKSNQKLVMNGILRVDDTIQVEISKTRDLFDDEDAIDWVRNADVYLHLEENTLPIQMEYKSKGIYSSKAVAEYGKKYCIEVVHNTFDNISASADMPDVTLGKVIYVGNTENQQNFELNITNQNSDNFYIWEMIERNSEGVTTNIEIFSGDSRTDNILPEETQVQRRIFLKGVQSDSFDGINSSFSASGLSVDQFENTEVRLITVNQDMYKYFRSLELYKNSKNNFVKPIEIYSNVDKGLGIFGAISENIIPVTE
jgi:hypothetical protein